MFNITIRLTSGQVYYRNECTKEEKDAILYSFLCEKVVRFDAPNKTERYINPQSIDVISIEDPSIVTGI